MLGAAGTLSSNKAGWQARCHISVNKIGSTELGGGG